MNLPHLPQAATTFSIISLVFSVASNIRTYKQDIRDDRRELRTLLERLVAIPREKLEASAKYAGNRDALFAFDQICNQENTLLSRQAAEIARRLRAKQEGSFAKHPSTEKEKRRASRYVSATEFLSVAFALQGAYNLDGAKEFLQLAADYAVDFNDEIAALRTLGYIEFLLGKHVDGRAKYDEASQIFAKYPNFDPYTKVSTNVQTELNWATAEASINDVAAVRLHLDRAQSLVNTMPDSPGAEGWKLQVAQAQQQFLRSQRVEAKPFPAPPIA